jgi:hypothetical protein
MRSLCLRWAACLVLCAFIIVIATGPTRGNNMKQCVNHPCTDLGQVPSICPQAPAGKSTACDFTNAPVNSLYWTCDDGGVNCVWNYGTFFTCTGVCVFNQAYTCQLALTDCKNHQP